MIERLNVTADLSNLGHTLTVHWQEPGEKRSVPSYRRQAFVRQDAPWEPWQVTGLVASVQAGTPLLEVCAGDKPRLNVLQSGVAAVGDALLSAVDRLTRGRSMAGGPR